MSIDLPVLASKVGRKPLGLTNSNSCKQHHTMKHSKNSDELKALKDAARLLGRLGGMSGTGKAKARPSDVCRKAVMKRWDAWRKARGEQQATTAMVTKPKATT
jgi:hypothetical protein